MKLLGTPAKLVKWSKKANVALLKAAIKVGRGHLDKIEHVDSHPEERLHRSRWNRNDEKNAFCRVKRWSLKNEKSVQFMGDWQRDLVSFVTAYYFATISSRVI